MHALLHLGSGMTGINCGPACQLAGMLYQMTTVKREDIICGPEKAPWAFKVLWNVFYTYCADLTSRGPSGQPNQPQLTETGSLGGPRAQSPCWDGLHKLNRELHDEQNLGRNRDLNPWLICTRKRNKQPLGSGSLPERSPSNGREAA